MEANGGLGEMGSLFEGMDLNLSPSFEIPDSEIQPADAATSKENPNVSDATSVSLSKTHSLHPGILSSLPESANSATPAISASHEVKIISSDLALARDPSGPLDESLFSGLSFSSADALSLDSINSHKDIEFAENHRTSQELTRVDSMKKEQTLIGSVKEQTLFDKTAITDKFTPKLSEPDVAARQSSFGSALSSHPTPTRQVVRRKRRGLKIGYGRDEGDFEEFSSHRTAQRVMDKDLIVSSVVTDAMFSDRMHGTQGADISQLDNAVLPSGIGLSSQAAHVSIVGVAENVPPLLPDKEEGVSLSEDSEQIVTGQTRSEKENENVEMKMEMQATGKKFLEEEEVKQPGEDQIDEEKRVEASQSGSSEVAMDAEKQVLDRVEVESISSESVYVELDKETILVNGADSGNASVETDKLNLEDRLLVIKSLVSAKVMNATKMAASASCEKKDAIQRRRQAARNVGVASLKRKELETELEKACEEEDFEMADKLNEKIADAEKDMEIAENSLREAEAQYDVAIIKYQEIIDLQIGIEEEGERLLEELKQEAEAAAKRVKKEADELEHEESSRLTSLKEEVELKQRKFSLELRVLDEATSELNTVIAESTIEETAEKISLINARALLEEELKELMARVRAKEADIAEHDKRIAEMDEKITNVSLKFEKQRADLDLEAKSIQSLLRELEEETALLDTEKLKLLETLQKADEERINLERVAEAAMNEWAAMHEAIHMKKAAVLSALQAKQKKTELVENETQASKEVQTLRQEAGNGRSYLQELASTKMKLQQEISMIQQKISYNEKRVPELESEKKFAATARNFKEAARLASEAKTLIAEKDALGLELDRLVSDSQKLDQEVESKLLVLAGKDQLIVSKEKDVAKARCERLRLIAKTAREERDIAVGLEDFEEAEILNTEAEAADFEADEIQKMHELQGEPYEKLTTHLAERGNKSEEGDSSTDIKILE